ncbi:MAG: hypothetical protein GY926_15860 [bacterium]|nr:hypothetical protein [bacterium]
MIAVFLWFLFLNGALQTPLWRTAARFFGRPGTSRYRITVRWGWIGTGLASLAVDDLMGVPRWLAAIGVAIVIVFGVAKQVGHGTSGAE